MGLGFFKPNFYGNANSRYRSTANMIEPPGSTTQNPKHSKFTYRINPILIHILRFTI
jgi:hypothetical protein